MPLTRYTGLLCWLMWELSSLVANAAVDWGGGGARFYGHDGQLLGSNGTAVLLSVHSGALIDYSVYLPVTPADLITVGTTLSDAVGNKNIILRTFSPFTAGYLLNSIVPDIIRASQEGYGAGIGEKLYLMVWDTATFASGAPAAGSFFAVLPLYSDGNSASPATTYGNLPPSLPLVAKPVNGTAEVHCNTSIMQVESTTLSLQAGWNLVSTPYVPLDPAPMAVFNGINTGPVWEWSTGSRGAFFQSATQIVTKRGYWVYCVVSGSCTIQGQAETDKRLYLRPGWNLIGPLQACNPPQASGIVGPAWYWNSVMKVYQTVGSDGTLFPGRGYWIYTTGNVEIDLP